ncbi:unnamed protein product [Haemonchus placei]|uniref:Uncharacterized protein n=1 Tax=Haemonchus placei TaxID=6290 RepID=A0A0N4VYC5_HAEPC|nr:unnamed protein product [Haemonchus placei]
MTDPPCCIVFEHEFVSLQVPPRSLRSNLPSHKIDDPGKNRSRDMCMRLGSRNSPDLITLSDYFLMGPHGYRATLPDVTTTIAPIYISRLSDDHLFLGSAQCVTEGLLFTVGSLIAWII